MTAAEQKSRTARSYKLILLFAMVSMTMMFAGLTSAFVVRFSITTGILLQYCSDYRMQCDVSFGEKVHSKKRSK